jgi:hypothetical protein
MTNTFTRFIVGDGIAKSQHRHWPRAAAFLVMFAAALLGISAVMVAFAAVTVLVDAAAAHADSGNGIYTGPKGDDEANAYWVDISPFIGAGDTVASAGAMGHDICDKMTHDSVVTDGLAISVMAQAMASSPDRAQPKIPAPPRRSSFTTPSGTSVLRNTPTDEALGVGSRCRRRREVLRRRPER